MRHGDKPSFLEICGHGDPSYIGPFVKTNFSTSLSGVSTWIRPNATVILNGCNTARSDGRFCISQAASNVLKMNVFGALGYVSRVSLLESGRTVCLIDRVVISNGVISQGLVLSSQSGCGLKDAFAQFRPKHLWPVNARKGVLADFYRLPIVKEVLTALAKAVKDGKVRGLPTGAGAAAILPTREFGDVELILGGKLVRIQGSVYLWHLDPKKIAILLSNFPP